MMPRTPFTNALQKLPQHLESAGSFGHAHVMRNSMPRSKVASLLFRREVRRKAAGPNSGPGAVLIGACGRRAQRNFKHWSCSLKSLRWEVIKLFLKHKIQMKNVRSVFVFE